MSKKVSLHEVTADNWEQVADLKIDKHQEEFVEDNAWSIAESKFNSYAVPRAIYVGKRPVGFIMWESHAEDGGPHDYSFNRLMIDKDHQLKGYGRKAMDQALAEIRKDRHVRRIVIYYVPENAVARDFYASFGFRELGIDEDGEMVAQLLPAKC
jgi:diamine N-acetyltransferase